MAQRYNNGVHAPSERTSNRPPVGRQPAFSNAKAMDLARLDEAAAASRELLAASEKREQPDAWSSNINSLAYAIIVGGKCKSEVGEVEKVLPMLREAIQTQDAIKALPDIAYTLDTLCDARTGDCSRKGRRGWRGST